MAISNHRLLAFEQERVTFRWKDYAHGSKPGTMTLGATEFLRPFLSPRATQRLRPHPSLRHSRQSLSGFPPDVGPTTARLRPLDPGRSSPSASAVREFFSLALPTLRRKHDRGSEIYRRGINSMHVLRFFLTHPSMADFGCARAHPCACVSSPRRSPLIPPFPDTLSSPYSRTHDLNLSLRSLVIDLLHSKLPFKSHSAPRPPQTPAASS